MNKKSALNFVLTMLFVAAVGYWIFSSVRGEFF